MNRNPVDVYCDGFQSAMLPAASTFHHQVSTMRASWSFCTRRSIGTSCPPLKRPLAALFPGQGSQYVGMGKDLAEKYPTARKIFDEVDAALNFKLTKVMFEGPPETLTLTCHAQPAILAVSYALLSLMKEQTGFDIVHHASYALGHSLGEYTALLATESITLSEAAVLVHKRGLAMQEGLPTNLKTSMVALIMRPNQIPALVNTIQEVQDKLAPGEVVDLSNVNSSFQAVLSGTHEAVERTCQELQKSRVAARAVELPVSAPFHCRLMEPAARVMTPHLNAVDFRKPKLPVVANVTMEAVTDPKEIPGLLRRQITGTVQWYPSIQRVRNDAGIHDWLVFGPNKVLASLLKKDFPADRVRLVESAQDIVPVME